MSKTKSKNEAKTKEKEPKLKMSVHAINWKRVINQLNLLDEANFIASERGVELRAMDPSRVAMVDLSLPPAFFEEFICKETCRFGINLDEMKQVVGRMKNEEMLEMTLIDNSDLEMKLISDSTRIFTIALLDLGESDYPAPVLEPKGKLKITTESMKDSIKDAEIIADHLTFSYEKIGVVLFCKSETKSYKNIIEADNDCVASLEVEEKVASTYSLSYLSAMFKNLQSTSLVGINISNSMPIHVEAPLGAGAKIQYFLAPRIET